MEDQLERWNDTARADVVPSLTDMFEAQVRRDPRRPAVVFGRVRLSYGELDARANRLARQLARLGVGPEDVVATTLPRSADVVVALLAILKAGAAYLPVDLAYPRSRVGYMLSDARPRLVLANADQVAQLSGVDRVLVLDDPDTERAVAACAAEDLTDADRVSPVSPNHPAYLIYTSGSTGRPKGVVIERRSVDDHVYTEWRAHPSTAGISLLHTSMSFAQHVTPLFVPLVAGGCVRVVAELTPDEPDVECTFFKGTPSHLSVLDNLPAGFSPTGELMLCGEALLGEVVDTWRRDHPGVSVTSGYGPTEVTIHCAEFTAAPGEPIPSGVVPLGRLMPNSQAYVLDQRLRPAPPGVTGELYLGGSGLARGYHRRPTLTAERFVADPFGEPGTRLYRTGDLARWTDDGVLEFAGRIDDQTKVRGFRVELGEISAAAVAHPSVAYAAALVREDRPGDQRIVCYLVPADGREFDRAALRQHLRSWLPAYLVPAAFVPLSALPMTPNGKLDHAALPVPEYTPAGTPRAPASATEELLCGLVADVLGVASVGVEDNFFELGGHSLLATRLIGGIRAALGVEVALRTVFDAPTVAELADRLGTAAAAPPPLRAMPRPELVPMSLAQRRLWFLHQFTGPDPTYNLVWAVRMSGPLDRSALAAAIADLLIRHESLRTVFFERDGESYQRVLRPERAGSALSIVDTEESGLADATAALARYPFDLAVDLPFRATLLSMGEREHALVLVMHHIVADGASMAPLVRDLSLAYAARVSGQAPDWAPLPVHYADFTLWQRENSTEDRLSGQIEYWRQTLAGSPELLELPIDRPRPAEASSRGGQVRFTVDARLHRKLMRLATDTGVTLFMVVHAALTALLTRMGAGTDIPIGTATAGRDDDVLADAIGFFVNTVVLRTDVAGDPSFRELLRRVREVNLGAYANQDVPFERLVEALNPARSLSHSPLFQVMLTYENGARARLDLPGISAQPYFVDAGAARFDLSFFAWATTTADGEPDGINGYLDYATDLFDAATAQGLVTRLVRLLGGAIADPDQPIRTVEILSEAERHKMVVLDNDTDVPVRPATLPELFAAQVRRVPDATAVVFADDELTYAELDARANKLARMLVQCGVGPERFVGVAMPRSVDLIVAFLAVLKAGAAYLAVDLSYPAERIAFMLADVDPVLVLTSTTAVDAVPASGNTVVLDDPRTAAAIAVLPDRDLTDDERTVPLRPHNPAFAIYTSGSTGRPKGVVVEHHSLNHYLAWAREVYPGVRGRALVHSSVSFDLTVTGMYAPLTSGGCVHLIELDETAGTTKEPIRPTFVKATPSHLPLLISLPARFSPTEQLVLGGEPLLGEVLDEWRAKHPDVTIFNEYGPTETTVECMDCHIVPGQKIPPGVVTLGKPSWNTRMYVLDAALRLVPDGVAGEIYIAGELITRGYHNRPALTAGRYVANPFGPPGSRMYRSGDLGRRRADGEYEFVARVDDQVKIRGYRIELGEIDTVLGQHPEVEHAAVIVREDQPGDRRLVAYYVPVGEPVDEAALRARCAEYLPEYMVPAAFVPMAVLPLTPNRKLDRRALPAPVYQGEADGRAPRSAREEILCGLFAEALGVPKVSIDDNFFALGGHSLLAVRLTSRIRSTFGVELGLRTLFESPTVCSVAEHIDNAETARPALRRMARPEEVS